MGRKIQLTGGNFPASAEMRVEGARIKGVFKGGREIKTKFGPKSVFSLTVQEATCTFLKDQKPYEPVENELVDVMGTTLLTNQLNQVKPGEVVTIAYAGLGKRTKGNAPHMFDVEVE